MTAARRLLHLLIALLAVVAPLTLVSGATTASAAAPAVPAVPSDLPEGIEDTADYVPVKACDPKAKPGTSQLGKLLVATYPGTSYGIARSCGTSADSEHKEGRAVDWMINARVKTQKAKADAMIAWLLATDADGNEYANARRLGVMYIIWNNKIFGLYNAERGWRPYSNCATNKAKSSDAACHRNHVHLSLSWEGAMAHTSFWSGEVAAPDYGPCRPADLNWAAPYKTANPYPCARLAKVVAPAGSSKLMKSLVTYSGMVLKSGSTGNAVKAVQKAIGVKADGKYGKVTKAAMKEWQTAHGLTASGGVNHTTWRALLADQAPAA